MNPLSRMGRRRLLSALLAAVFFAPALLPAQEAQPPGLNPYAQYEWGKVMVENNPFDAANFVGRDQNAEKTKVGDPAAYAKLFARAAELQDLKNLVSGLPEQRAITLGLQERPSCAFCQDPVKMKEWAKAYLGYLDKQHFAALDAALLEWGSLAEERRTWLASQGQNEAAWAALKLPERHEKLRLWAKAEYDRLMKVTPKDRAEAERMKADYFAASGLLSNEETATVWERVQHAETSIDSLERASKALGRNADPKLRAALAQAQNAPDLETRLAKLGTIFDGLKIESPVLRAAAPPTKGQTFDDPARTRVAALLKTGIMKQTEGTWAGDELAAFYKNRPLDIVVAPAANGIIGFYSNDKMTFNEKFIAEYVKSKGRTLDDLSRDPSLLRPLVVELTPLFVHEATHHRQDVWAREQKIPSNWSQHQELEAMQVEALFILEKSMRDPSFAKQLDADRASSLLARESISKAERLRKGGPGYFRDTIAAWHYPERLSLEGITWCTIAWHNHVDEPIKKELDRRAALPDAEKAALEKVPAGDDKFPTMEAFVAGLPKVGTPQLREWAKAHGAAIEAQPEIYQKYRDRLAGANQATQDRLNTLLSEKDPTKTRAKGGGVPSPVGPP